MSRSIDRRWLPLNALRAFEGVARHGTFTAAAQALLTSQSALSRHVIALADPTLFAAELNSGSLVKPFEAATDAGYGYYLMTPPEELRGGRLVRPFDVALDDGYGYYLITHPEDLSDTAIAMFRSWLIERFQHRPNATPPQVRLAVSNE